MKILKIFPIFEMLFISAFYTYSTYQSILLICVFLYRHALYLEGEDPIWEFHEYFKLFSGIYIDTVLLLSIFIFLMFIFADLNKNKWVLKIFEKSKRRNSYLFKINIITIILSPTLLGFISWGKGYYFFGIIIFSYLVSFAGHFTIFILLWRFFDKFKDKPFAIKLRNLKKKFYAKTSKRLFKAYIKNKLIRKKIVSTL